MVGGHMDALEIKDFGLHFYIEAFDMRYRRK